MTSREPFTTAPGGCGDLPESMKDMPLIDARNVPPPSFGPVTASIPLYEVVGQMKQAGMTEAEIAEVLARTPAEDEYEVIKEVLHRRKP